MISIQTNVNSLVAQQNLSVNSSFQSKTIQQLTSGYRINQSGDDAAGLAVANKFRSTIAELTQGVANGNDATAQLQIMDGGMNNISLILDRLKTLATQSASGTFTGNRQVLNGEFQNALSEIDRQAQSIGLNTGGLFAKNLDVFLGAGSGSTSLQNGIVTLGLTQSAVDSQSLGMRGMLAVNLTSGTLSGTNAGTDIGSTSATSVQNIVGNVTGANLNQQATAGYAALQFSGAGFADSGKVGVSVNLAGVTDVATLATAINSAIESAGNGTTASATAFKNANIVASVHTDSAGGQQLAFSSGTAAFQVQAGDQMGNALLGNVATVGGVAKGTAISGTAATTVTGAITQAGTGFSAAQKVKLVVTGGGLAGPVTLEVNTTSQKSTTEAITDLENQFSGSAALQAAGLTMSGSSTVGGQLSFNSASGQGFNIQVTGDSANLLGLGSFLADSSGNADYAKITAGAAYSAAAVTGSTTSTGMAAGLEISLNGQGSTALTAIDLTTGANAVAALATGASIATAAVDITLANRNLNITVTNNGVATTKAIVLDLTAQVATSGTVATDALTQATFGTKNISAANRNNEIMVSVNGATAVKLTLDDNATTTAAGFMTDLQAKISGSSLGATVTASWDATTDTLKLTATSTGATSSVAVSASTYASKGAVASVLVSTGDAITTPAAIVTGVNDKFNIAVDGGASVLVTVGANAGSSKASLAAAIQAGIDGTSLVGKVTAAVDAGTGEITLTSVASGAASSVNVSAGAAQDALGSLGFTAGTGRGADAAVNGGLVAFGLNASTATQGLADVPSTVTSIATKIATALGGAAKVTVTNTNQISIESTTKGANSAVTINAGTANSTLGLPAAVTTTKGTNSTIGDIVSNLNAQFAANSTYQAAGLQAVATLSDGTASDAGTFVSIQSTNGTQFRLNAVGATTAATAGAIASAKTNQGTWTSLAVAAANTNNTFNIAVDGGGAVSVTVADGTYNDATTLLDAVNAGITGSALSGLVTAGWDATTNKLTLTSATTGAASSVTVSAAGGNTGLGNLGFAASTNSGHQVQVTENTGFGIAGSTFVGAAASSTGTAMSAVDAFGISNSQAFTFSAMKFGNDKQALTFSATNANGVLETKTITLENNKSTNRAGASIDDAVAYINTQLQQSTSQPALQQIVAVKENVGGQEKINFVSSLSGFTVGVAATASGDGLNSGGATQAVQRTSVANGDGANMQVDSKEAAKAAVSAIATAIGKLGSAQAAVGKGQNQLYYAVNLAQSQITNFSAAESYLRDANVAQQAANLTKAQVLSQASIAAMAQANSAPQAVLALLRG